MRYIKLTSLIILAAALLQSCTKVIDVKLKDADRKFVVEGNLTDVPGHCSVLLSKTKNFSENNSFNSVNGAIVTITDDNSGTVATLDETAPGVYTNASFSGVPTHAYTLKVQVDGNTFTAVSTIPSRVTFDSLYVTDADLFGNTNKFATLEFQDPATFGNCYQARQYVNGKVLKNIFVTNDDYSNGKLNKARLISFTDNEDEKVKVGDTVTVDMLCIDPLVYKYWYSLDQGATGNSQSAAPANPVTNMQGGAIGYFSAHTIETKTVIAE